MPVNIELVRVGQPDNRGDLVRSYGASAINGYLQDTTLTKTERGYLKQLGRTLGKLNRGRGLFYVASRVVPYEWHEKNVRGQIVYPLASAYIKFWDTKVAGDYNSLLLRVRNPETVYEYDIEKAFTDNHGQPDGIDHRLNDAFSYYGDRRGELKPSLEVALVQRDNNNFNDAAARIKWEWDAYSHKVVTRGHVHGRNDIIPDEVQGLPEGEIPIVTFTRMRNAVILQSAS